MVLIIGLICLFLILLCFIAIRYFSFKLNRCETIENIRVEPSESDFRKLFEAPSDTFQQFVRDSEDRCSRRLRRYIVALRVVIVVLCVIFACAFFGCSCSTTRSLSNTYNVTLDTLQYKFNFEHSENVSAKRQ